jgi:DHA2 family multidrug resistance protein
MLMVPAALTTAFMMPIIGNLLQKGVPQQYLVAGGMLLFAVFTIWGYYIITPDTGKEAFTWMLIVRGIGMGMLFIPITTLSLSSLKGQQIGQGAAFTGMMRQLGGSFGIALITTVISRRTILHRNDLISNLTPDNPIMQQRLTALKNTFMAKGQSADEALRSAYKILDISITKQASVLSYMDIFMYLGVLFIICVPIMFFVKSNKKQKISLADAAH